MANKEYRVEVYDMLDGIFSHLYGKDYLTEQQAKDFYQKALKLGANPKNIITFEMLESK
jgi:hypothetical protein